MSYRMRQRAVRDFENWTVARGAMPTAETAERWRARITILLQCRDDHLDKPDPTRWRSGDVHELFMDYVVPRQVDAWGLAGHGLDSIRDYLRFLDATDRLHPASTRVPTLLKELDRLMPKYRAAMADTSRWRLAKRMFTAMIADGLGLDAEPAELNAWAERLSARDAAGRREVLGDLMDQHAGYADGPILIHDGRVAVLAAGTPPAKHLVWPDLACDCGCEQPAQFPPVMLPDPDTLAKSVATDGAGLLRELADLAAWVGEDGHAVDSRGELTRADRQHVASALGLATGAGQPRDTPALARLWRLALDFDVLRLRRTRILPGTGAMLVASTLNGDGPSEQAVELWCDVTDALVHPSAPPTAPKELRHLRDWLGPWVPRLLGMLYAASHDGEPADLNALTDQVLDEYAHRLPPGDSDLFAALVATSIRQTLADLDKHGAVEVTGVRAGRYGRVVAGARLLGTATWALRAELGLQVCLTDLGRYAVRQRLLDEGAHAPLVTAETTHTVVANNR